MSMLDEMFEDFEKNVKLNERPYSRSQESMDDVKGKVKGFFGSGQVEQGAAETGRMANKLWSDFKRAIGQKYGASQKSVPFSDVKQFFTANELDTSVLGTNERMTFTPKDVGQAILQASRNYMNQLGVNQPKKAAQTQEPTKEPESQDVEAKSSEDEVVKTAPSADDKQTALSPLKGQLSSLSAEDRQKLLRMLS